MDSNRRTSIRAELNDPGDEEIQIHEILFREGDSVEVGDTLFIAEGSKSIFDIVSPIAGTFHPLIEAESRHEIGTHIAFIASE